MVLKDFCVLVHKANVASALEGLRILGNCRGSVCIIYTWNCRIALTGKIMVLLLLCH